MAAKDAEMPNHTALSEEVGYIPLPDDVLAAQQAKLDSFLPEPGAATPEAEARAWR